MGDHTATVTVAPHLQRDMEFVNEQGMSPYDPSFVVLDGKTFYKDLCPWGNGERKLTAFKQEHRV